MTTELLTANHASAIAATLAGRANRKARGFGAGIYPITPQSESIELLCKQEFEKGSVVRVESEHSAMAVCMGMSLSGLRTWTASSANGLAYMVENVYAAAFYRLPIVMMAVNRTLGPPWNIWLDHGDTLMLRDTGWIQFYCQDNQEVFDSILLAFRLAEDSRVLVPVLVCQDAFVLSHTMMPTDIPEQPLVDRFLPELHLPHQVADRAVTVGALDRPREVEMHRQQHAQAMERGRAVYAEVQDSFEDVFGRRPADAVVPYRMDGAEIALLSMGTTASTVETAVDAAREKGIPVGALRLRMYRPFPEADLRRHFAGLRRLGVIDRDISLGHGGVLWSETRSLVPNDCLVQNYMAGLGGGDVRPAHVLELLEDLQAREHAGEPAFVETGS